MIEIDAAANQAAIRNDLVEIVAQIANGNVSLTLSALAADGRFVPILQRAGQNRSEVPLRAEMPDNCQIEAQMSGDAGEIVIKGSVGPATLWICLRLGPSSPWIEVSEVLCLDSLPETTTVDWFEAVWQFVDWTAGGEVFSPSLVPEENDLIGRHMMRSPVLTAQCQNRSAALVNSLDGVYRMQVLPAAMNLLRDNGVPVFRTGLRPHRLRGHVYFEYAPSPAWQKRFHHSYHLYVSAGAGEGDALQSASRHIWGCHGPRGSHACPPMPLSYDQYAQEIYPRVLDLQWAQTRLNGKSVGAIRINRAYPNDVWMCPWFSQVRSAYGMYLWGKWLGQGDWMDRAVATRDLHLAAPQTEGLFPTVFVFGTDESNCRWVHSHHQGGGPGIYHLMDMSWTVYQLLRWHGDVLADAQTVRFARAYCDGIIQLQRDDGSFPAYVDADSRRPVARVSRSAVVADLESHPGGDSYVLDYQKHWCEERYLHSAEDAANLLALARCAGALEENDPDRQRFIQSALRSAQWLRQWAFPQSRWVDFEVYFSCAPKTLDFYDGRSGQWPQNLLCLHMAAAGLLELHQLTGQQDLLHLAKWAMSRLCLHQQVWDPPFLNFCGFGGYGAQNSDGEWSDARQGQFADTHLDFWRLLGDPEQLQRAQAACRASFSTVFLPASSTLYPTGWCQQPRGMAAENHGHGGRDMVNGVSSFDWGSGSALATAAYLRLNGTA